MNEQSPVTPAMPSVDRFPAHSMELGKIASALAKAQGSFPDVKKNKHVKVRTKTGGTYEFDYADLSGILTSCKEALAANELSVSQMILPNGTGLMLRTMLLHSSGEFLSSATFLTRRENPQELGSEITYMRRYAIASMLGIAADDDDDGNLAAGNTAEPKNNSRPQQPPPPKVDVIALADKDGKPDWEAFKAKVMEAIAKAPDTAYLHELLKVHNAPLSNLKGLDQAAFDELKAAADARRAEFAGKGN